MSRKDHFKLTPAVVEANRKLLKKLPFDKLAQICVVERTDTRSEKKKLIDRIMSNRVKNHHPINEERYQFVEWLYRIRTQYPRMGLFQPDFIWVIFGKMMVSKYNRSDSDIKKAVHDWCKDPAKATAKYGHISKWNTSLVTNMKQLFSHKRNFNGDISKWDVSKVTNMESMFQCAVSFNGDISEWDVSNVTDMGFMFNCFIPGQESVSAFNGDISKWNVSKVTTMGCMFQCAVSFDGDISGWDVSNVTDMSDMFNDAVSFNGDISKWNVSKVTNMGYMFTDCPIPEEHKPRNMV